MKKDNSIYRLKRAKLIQLTLTIGIESGFLYYIYAEELPGSII